MKRGTKLGGACGAADPTTEPQIAAWVPAAVNSSLVASVYQRLSRFFRACS